MPGSTPCKVRSHQYGSVVSLRSRSDCWTLSFFGSTERMAALIWLPSEGRCMASANTFWIRTSTWRICRVTVGCIRRVCLYGLYGSRLEKAWGNGGSFVVGADDRKSSTDRFGMNQRRGYRRLLRWPTYTPVHCRFRRGLTGKKYIMKLTQGSLLQVGLRAILQLAAVG